MEVIHIVLGKANPERMNGVNKVVYQLATRQAALGKKVSVWGITPDLTNNYGDRTFETRLYRAHRNAFFLDSQLVTDLNNLKRDVVIHLHGGWIPVFSTISRQLAQLKIPFVFTPHGAYNMIAMKRSKFRKLVYFKLFERKLLERSSRIHCIGQSEVTGLSNIFKTQKTFLIPYGFSAPATLPGRIIHENGFIIGFVGRLDIYTKGLDLLIDAIDVLRDKGLEITLWIIGDGGERTKLEQIVVEGHLENNVIFWGGRFGLEKDELMLQMDAFAHPSRNEGLPTSVLEAASLGVPCIVSEATNVGQCIVDYNAGRKIENENVKGLVSSIEELYKMKEAGKITELSLNAQRMVKEQFNWDHIIGEFEKLYQ